MEPLRQNSFYSFGVELASREELFKIWQNILFHLLSIETYS